MANAGHISGVCGIRRLYLSDLSVVWQLTRTAITPNHNAGWLCPFDFSVVRGLTRSTQLAPHGDIAADAGYAPLTSRWLGA
jgi:hypothetical protein